MAQSNLTNNQLLMWIGQKRHPDKPLYNMIHASTIHGEVDADRFKQAFTDLVMQVDSLRLTIHEVDDMPVQQVSDSVPQALDIVQLSDEDYAEWFSERGKRILDLSQSTYDSALVELSNNHYIWYFNQHHIAIDAMSFYLLYKRLEALYRGEHIADPPQFMPYVEHEIAHRQTDAFANAQQYWHDIIAKEFEPLKFYGQAYDNQQTAVTRTLCKLTDAQLEQVNTLAQRRGIRTFSENLTRFSIFFALYASFISHITQQSNFLVGMPFQNRVNAEQRDIAGLIIETGVMEVSIDPDTTFIDLIKATNKQMMKTLQNVQPGISTAQMNRSYEVIFNYIPVELHDFAGMPVDAEWLTSEDTDSIHCLHARVGAFDASEKELFQFDFSQALFTDSLVEKALQHFETLINALLSDPDTVITQAQLLTPEEYHKIVVEWNNTDADYGDPVPVHVLFERQAQDRPNHPAVVSDAGQMTYAELNARANQLAHYLIANGVGAETLIAVATERSFDMVIGLLGTLKAGAAYVPVDTMYPNERIQFMLEDTNAPFVLAQSHVPIEPSADSRVLYLDAMADTLSHQPTYNPRADVTPDNLAYVIYTSGSTGRPKGVMIPHRNFCNHLHYLRDVLDIRPQHGMLQKSTFSFDAGMFEIFSSLMWGATLYLTHPTVPRDVDKMYEAFVSFPITHCVVVPTQLNLLLRDYDFSRCTHMRHIVSGGEALPPELLRDTLTTLPGIVIDNLYGPAECTIDATHWATRVPADPVLIGKPVTNTQVYILDSNLRVLPVGMAGELYIGGVQLARGYLNRPDLTNERFIEHPEFGRLYRTGDLVRWVDDGNIEMLGRTDFQVKISGARVEPGEVENQILTYDGVDEVVVSAYTTTDNVTLLVAYVVGEVDHEVLRQNLRNVLPMHMIPSIFVPIDTIPLTPNGKVNRSALKQIDLTNYRNTREYIPPATDTQATIAEIWQNILDRDRIGIHDDFFALGGHSLPAVRICSRINNTYDIALPINDFFNHPTIEQLATVVEEILLAEIDALSDEEVLRLLEEDSYE